jgi:hypothetical protein
VAGGDSAVAVQIAGSAGLFPLVVAFLLSIFPVVIVTLAAVLILSIAVTMIHGEDSERGIKAALGISLLFSSSSYQRALDGLFLYLRQSSCWYRSFPL